MIHRPLFIRPAGPIARSALASLAIRVAALGFVTVQAIATARLLGPEGYGAVAYVTSLSMIAATVALLGTEGLAVREVARLVALEHFAAVRRLIRTLRVWVIAACGIGALGLLAVLTTVVSTDGEFGRLPLFTALLFPLFALNMQTQGILRGLGRAALAQIPFQLLRPVIMVTCLGAMLLWHWPLAPHGFLQLVAIAAAVALAMAFVAERTSLRPFEERPSNPAGAARPPAQPAWGQALPFLCLSLLGLLIGEVSTLMLAWLAEPAEVGLFQPVARLAPLLLLGMQAVSMRYAPRISELWTTGERQRLAGITATVTLTTTGFSLVAGIGLLILAPWILSWFGQPFVAVAPALWWVVGAQVFNTACGPVGLLLTMTEKAGRAVLPQLAGLGTTVLVGVALIPDEGALGAAKAMSAGIVAWNTAMLLVVRRRLGMDPSLVGAIRTWRRQGERS